jgi:hypothetical protein
MNPVMYGLILRTGHIKLMKILLLSHMYMDNPRFKQVGKSFTDTGSVVRPAGYSSTASIPRYFASCTKVDGVDSGLQNMLYTTHVSIKD